MTFRKQWPAALLLTGALALAACGAPAQPQPQATAAPASTTASQPTQEPSATAARATEPVSPLPTPGVAESPLGAPASRPASLPELLAALESSGATVQIASTIEQPFFEVQGQELKINGQSAQVFEWADETSREAVSQTITPQGQFGTTMVEWVGTPHFWASGKLIVLYVGESSDVVDLLSGALGAPIAQG